MNYECMVCGLSGYDLPIEIEQEYLFEQTGDVTHCVTCNPEDRRYDE